MKIKLFFLSFLFLLSFQNVQAQELSMYSGFWSMQFYQDSEKISKQEFVSLIQTEPEAAQLWNKSKSHMTYAWVAFGAQLGFLVWQFNKRDNRDSQVAPLVGNIAAGITAIGFSISSMSLKKKSILAYNRSKDTGSINLGPTYNGFGLVYTF